MPFEQNFCAIGADRQRAVVFDYGPSKAELPNQRPSAPDANLVGAARVEAWETYERDTSAYERARNDYMAAKREYDEWHAANPAVYPVKKIIPLIDAKEAVERGRGRYAFSFPEPATAVAEASHG